MNTVMNPWRTVDRPAIGWDDSSELIQRAAALQIIDNLPAQITIQQTLWEARDQDWATDTNRPMASTTIKSVNPRSVYLGHRLDLQVAPNDTLPAITVRCLDSAPSEDRVQPDQYDSLELVLIVEVWVSSGPFDDPVANQSDQDQIDRQLHRLTAAVRGCINADRSLGSTTMGIQRPPRSRSSLPFVRKSDATNVGKKFLVQATELTYSVTSLVF